MALFSKLRMKIRACKSRRKNKSVKSSKIDKKHLKNAKKEDKLEKKAIKSENLAHKKAQKKLAAKAKLKQRAQENVRNGAKARVQTKLLPKFERRAPHVECHEQEEWDLPGPNVMPLTVFEKLEMERAKRCPSGPCDKVENIRLPPIDYYGTAISALYFFESHVFFIVFV